MSIIFILAAIAIVFIVLMKTGNGTKATSGPFESRCIASKDKVDLILEKSNHPLSGLVQIPEGTTVIGYAVFSEMDKITECLIHEKVKTVGVQSFKNCTSLKEIYTGEGTETIGEEAFMGDNGLIKLTIGPRTKTIQARAFARCNNLTTIVLEGFDIPEIFKATFDEETRIEGTLIVNKGCINKISTSPVWCDFKNVVEKE